MMKCLSSILLISIFTFTAQAQRLLESGIVSEPIRITEQSTDQGIRVSMIIQKMPHIANALRQLAMTYGKSTDSRFSYTLEGLYLNVEAPLARQLYSRGNVTAGDYKVARFEPYAYSNVQISLFLADSAVYRSETNRVALDQSMNLISEGVRKQLVELLMKEGNIDYFVAVNPRSPLSGIRIEKIQCLTREWPQLTCELQFLRDRR